MSILYLVIQMFQSRVRFCLHVCFSKEEENCKNQLDIFERFCNPLTVSFDDFMSSAPHRFGRKVNGLQSIFLSIPKIQL